MSVMLVWHMRMRVPKREMPMPVTVGSGRQWIMKMFVMPIIMAVGVLVFHFFVLMLVAVALDEVNQNSSNHQDSASQHPPAADALTQCDGQ
jgi:hypothetical protein